MNLIKELSLPDLRGQIGRILWKLGVTPALVRHVARQGRFALVMHGVSPAFDPSLPASVQPHHTAQEMRQTLSWLKHYFTLLTHEQFLNSDHAGVLLTFDDGFANNVDVLLPILEEFDAPAVFFVTVQHVLNPRDWLPATRRLIEKVWHQVEDMPETTARNFYDGMTVGQLQACAQHPLITIASHTISHAFLSRCSLLEQENEISGSKRLLEEMAGKPVDYFAYPTGDYDARTIQLVQQAGYKAAFAVDPLRLGALQFEIPRVGLYSSEPSYLGLKLSGLYRPPLHGKILSD